MYVGLVLSIRTITACPALLVNLTLTVVPKTDHKLYDYLPTSAYTQVKCLSQLHFLAI